MNNVIGILDVNSPSVNISSFRRKDQPTYLRAHFLAKKEERKKWLSLVEFHLAYGILKKRIHCTCKSVHKSALFIPMANIKNSRGNKKIHFVKNEKKLKFIFM